AAESVSLITRPAPSPWLFGRAQWMLARKRPSRHTWNSPSVHGGTLSLSKMVTVAPADDPTVTPIGWLKEIEIVSLPSLATSSRMGTWNDLSAASPSAHSRVPPTAV